MPYDFETLRSRAGTGACKWNMMKRQNPQVAAGIVPFSVADMEFLNPPEITQALKELLDRVILGYTEEGESYTGAVCRWMARRHGYTVNPADMLQSPGVVNALFHGIRALSEPGEGVIVMTPSYGPFFEVISRTGRRLCENRLIYQNGRFTIDFEDLERHAKQEDVRVLLLCSPHNPTGRVWTREELSEIGKICLTNGVFVLADEIHHDMIAPGHKHTVFATLGPEHEKNSIICTAPSKTFNLAGLQVSNIIIANQSVRERYERQMDLPGHSLNAFAYCACQTAYDQCEGWLEELNAYVAENRRLLRAFCSERLPRVAAPEAEGTYLQWLDFTAKGHSHEALQDLFIHKAQLFFSDGLLFGQAGRGFMRMNLACPRRVLLEGLERMEAALEKE